MSSLSYIKAHNSVFYLRGFTEFRNLQFSSDHRPVPDSNTGTILNVCSGSVERLAGSIEGCILTVRIVTDSTSDLSPQVAEELGITIVPVYVRFGERVYRDGVDISQDEFYQKLAQSPVHPSTSQPSPSDFADVYSKLSKETGEIVSMQSRYFAFSP